MGNTLYFSACAVTYPQGGGLTYLKWHWIVFKYFDQKLKVTTEIEVKLCQYVLTGFLYMKFE